MNLPKCICKWYRWYKQTFILLKMHTKMVENYTGQFWSFLENTRSDGRKRCVDLNSASIYSFSNAIHHKLPNNRISIVMGLFNLFGIPKNSKTLYFNKLDLFQLLSLQSILVYNMDYNNVKIMKIISFSKLRALLVRRSCNIPLM